MKRYARKGEEKRGRKIEDRKARKEEVQKAKRKSKKGRKTLKAWELEEENKKENVC